MALFGKKEKSLADLPGMIHDEDEVLGYLDEVVRQRIPLTLRTKEDDWECRPYSLEIKQRLLRIEDAPGLQNYEGKPMQCGFSLDNTWFVFATKLVVMGDKPYVLFPAGIQHRERRKKNRIPLSTREGVKVTALQGFGMGVGITGSGVEISEDAIAASIERALMLENERKLPVNRDLLAPGTPMGVIKVSGLPGVPTFQIEGEVLRIVQQGGWRIVFALKKLPGKYQSAIRNLVAERYLPFKLVRRSYKRRQEIELERQKEKEAANAPVTTKEKENQEQQTPVTLPPRKGNVTFTREVENQPLDNLSPTPNQATITEETPPQPGFQGQILLSIGDELKQDLAFLGNLPHFRWIHVDNPLKIIKTLNEAKPTFLFSPHTLKRQSMLDYLEKIASMGVLGNVQIVLFTMEKLPPRDIIRCRMLGIQNILTLPLENTQQLQDIIEQNSSDQP